ncbi:MAG: DNA translocase FtsK 4TM domain-containing protein [Gemmatimonadota bacterium]
MLGLLVAATGGFVCVALWPFDPVATRSLATLNLVGLLGSYSAFYLYLALGSGALLVGLMLLAWGALLLLDRASRAAAGLTLAAIAATVVSLTLLGIAGTWSAEPAGWTARSGALGQGIASALVGAVGVAGATLFCLVALALLAVAAFRISLGRGVEAGVALGRLGGRHARGGAAALAARASRWRQHRRTARLARAAGGATPVVTSAPDPEAALETGPDTPPADSAAAPADGPVPSRPRRLPATPDAPPARRSGRPPASFLPPLDLLDPVPPVEADRGADELQRLGDVLIEKLRSFNVQGEIVGLHAGPVLTQFEVKPAPGVKVNQIANLADDLALAMRAQRIRIVAPLPGKGAVGIEVPNPNPRMVTIRELIESPAWRDFPGKVPLALGREIAGSPIVTDLTRMPHLLIAGATGAGKSVCIHAIVTSLLYRYGPEDVRMIMIDPKMLELITYNGIPHLLHPVVVEHRQSAKALKWTVAEMERRYRLLAANGVRSLQDFNARILAGGDDVKSLDGSDEPLRRLPYIVVLIDELADLMLTVQNEIEEPLARLAQMARAVGIHLILATQRPSVNVITGVIKANFPSRLSFQVSSKIDSRTVLDMNGAEQLLGNGDMLYLPADRAEPLRIQGAFVSTAETARIVAWLREAAAALNAAVVAPPVDIIAEAVEAERIALDERDELFLAAARVVVDHDQGSTSLLQRRLRVGYSRAARILDQLERAQIVGPPDGTKPREVLISAMELAEREEQG